MNPTANAYLRNRVLSAKPAELRLMLLEGAIRFATQARDGLKERNFERVFEGFEGARNIVMELINILAPEHNPELCRRLTSLYSFMYRRLIEASLEKSPEIVDEVIGLLEYERETWVLLIEKLNEEQADPAPASLSLRG